MPSNYTAGYDLFEWGAGAFCYAESLACYHLAALYPLYHLRTQCQWLHDRPGGWAEEPQGTTGPLARVRHSGRRVSLFLQDGTRFQVHNYGVTARCSEQRKNRTPDQKVQGSTDAGINRGMAWISSG